MMNVETVRGPLSVDESRTVLTHEQRDQPHLFACHIYWSLPGVREQIPPQHYN
jgi:hypothetical protein